MNPNRKPARNRTAPTIATVFHFISISSLSWPLSVCSISVNRAVAARRTAPLMCRTLLLDSGNRRSRNSSNDFRFSSSQYWPARTSQRYLPSSTNLVSRSFSCRASQARIASILLRTSWARRRFSLGGMGGYLVTKFVKQTKIDSRLADQPALNQIALVEAEPKKRAGRTRVLGEADAAVRQEQSRFDTADGVVDQGGELLRLLVGDGG